MWLMMTAARHGFRVKYGRSVAGQDTQIMKQLILSSLYVLPVCGSHASKLPIAWTRISRRRFNEAGLQFYDDLLMNASNMGLSTLSHTFEMLYHLVTEYGGWKNKVIDFVRFVAVFKL